MTYNITYHVRIDSLWPVDAAGYISDIILLNFVFPCTAPVTTCEFKIVINTKYTNDTTRINEKEIYPFSTNLIC